MQLIWAATLPINSALWIRGREDSGCGRINGFREQLALPIKPVDIYSWSIHGLFMICYSEVMGWPENGIASNFWNVAFLTRWKRERIKGWARKSVEVLQNTRETEENKILPSLFTLDSPNYGVCVCVFHWLPQELHEGQHWLRLLGDICSAPQSENHWKWYCSSKYWLQRNNCDNSEFEHGKCLLSLVSKIQRKGNMLFRHG